MFQGIHSTDVVENIETFLCHRIIRILHISQFTNPTLHDTACKVKFSQFSLLYFNV